ncbi:MAG: TerB family tellurite resistance protein [Gammaproteobacteria bacterium]|nr:TerB family tellurite resistance protein [Gammaproteobacteria bacterium]
MLKRLKIFLEESLSQPVTENSDPHTIQLAAALLLVEVMHADHQIDHSERVTITQALKSLFDLDDEESAELLELAEKQAKDVISLHEYTSIINKSFDVTTKHMLLEKIWAVVFSDQDMDKYEEHLVRNIAELLYISHTDFIRIKHRIISS